MTNDKEMVEGVDYYIDENGLLVMTESYHRKRGSCCGSGCRHCPWDHQNVPESNRQLPTRGTSAKNKDSNGSE